MTEEAYGRILILQGFTKNGEASVMVIIATTCIVITALSFTLLHFIFITKVGMINSVSIETCMRNCLRMLQLALNPGYK
jgi:hypothetical protein